MIYYGSGPEYRINDTRTERLKEKIDYGINNNIS